MANVKRYNLAQFKFNEETIRVGSFKTTIKQSTTKLKACNSHKPYAVMFDEEELSWEVSNVDPMYRSFFENIMNKQKADPTDLAMVATYDYSEITNDLQEDDVFDDVWVEELSKDTANKPFSAKGSAMKRIEKV